MVSYIKVIIHKTKKNSKKGNYAMKKVLFLCVMVLFLVACSNAKSMSEYQKMFEDAGWTVEVHEDDEDDLGEAMLALFDVKKSMSFTRDSDDAYGTILEFKSAKKAKAFYNAMSSIYEILDITMEQEGVYIFVSNNLDFFEIIK